MAWTDTTAVADKIPFDILCHIFNYYAQMETLDHPLETILLICRSWSNAAIDYGHLWCTISISFRELADLKSWRTRVSRRLIRCSPDGLFDIQLVDISEYSRSWFEEMSWVAAYNKLLSSLAGVDHELVHRWQRLRAFTGLNPKSNLRTYLSYPTPNLEQLDVSGLFPSESALPYTPILKRFHCPSRWASTFPQLTTITDLGFDHYYKREESLVGSTSVIKLTIYNAENEVYNDIGTFPSVTHLDLSWPAGEDEKGVGHLVTPALKHLELCIGSGEDFEWILQCEGLPLGQVEQVTLTSRNPLFKIHDGTQALKDGLHNLLVVMASLRVLELNGPIMPALVANVIREGKLSGQNTLLLNVDGREVGWNEMIGILPDGHPLDKVRQSAVEKSWTEVYRERWSTTNN